ELFPALPFRSGTLSGEILITGNRAGFSVESDLSGPSGGIQFAGSVELGEVVTVNLQGNLRAFAAGMILRPEVPVEGPLTGAFSVRGTSRRLSFNVGLSQAEGSFALTGTAHFGNGPVGFDVAGNIVNFR